MNYINIYTNNPRVSEMYSGAYYQKIDIHGFLIVVRDQIHGGCKLLSDPMPASRRMMESPYRSVLLALPIEGDGGTVDLHSLETIEKAILHYERIQNLKNPLDQTVMDDFQYVDEQLLQSTLKELGIS